MAAAWQKLPKSLLEALFSFLDVSDLRICSLVCKHWYRFLNDENNDVWRLHCVRKFAELALKSSLLCNVPTYKAKLKAFYHAWNPNDCSNNVFIKSGFTLHRNPVAQTTDGARGKIGFRSGRHCWEVWWEGPLGTVAMIGLKTKDSPVQCQGYFPLVGSDSQSWGWNLVDNNLIHNGGSQGNYPPSNNAPKYQVSTLLSHKLFQILDGQTVALLMGTNRPPQLNCGSWCVDNIDLCGQSRMNSSRGGVGRMNYFSSTSFYSIL